MQSCEEKTHRHTYERAYIISLDLKCIFTVHFFLLQCMESESNEWFSRILLTHHVLYNFHAWYCINVATSATPFDTIQEWSTQMNLIIAKWLRNKCSTFYDLWMVKFMIKEIDFLSHNNYFNYSIFRVCHLKKHIHLLTIFGCWRNWRFLLHRNRHMNFVHTKFNPWVDPL